MRLPVLLALVLCLCAAARGEDADVRIAGALSTKPLLDGIVHAMKQEKDLHVVTATGMTSVDALGALATGTVGIAIITKPLDIEDRADYPAIDFDVIPIGMEVVALGVSEDVWNAGVHRISRDTMKGIYEQKVTNWKQLGGPDEKITLFNMAQGQGIWEIFAEWLYGDNRRAPFPKVEKVNTSEDARDSLEFTPGSIAPMSAALVDGSHCHALAVEVKGGTAMATPADVAAKRYPIVRPVSAVVVGRPTLSIRMVTEYLVSPAGQALVRKSGDLGLDAVPKPPPAPY